ncbi:hypothetical protein SAY87_010985 [Trapa incisa]|uniref:BRX domain-containing protein n=2 Tax=Trapa TaxID=22665 RepID=A0AAN7MD27_TRANT|nr:hypothetical protein SAY87_010985 [Trapa incisa]KAK4794541.1 hypothetical protein SAY86_012535 [Trapa natans]
MFTCIACTKQTVEDGGEGSDGAARGGGSSTPSSKEAVKSLTTQLKDMALKISGCTSSSTYKKDQRPYPDFDTVSEGAPYPFLGVASSSSTPAWDFKGGSHHHPGRANSRFGPGFGGDSTPRGVSISAQSCDAVLEDEDDPKEWMAQVEPGVHITFVSLPNGGNDLKRIRFSRDMFDKWQAQRWWAENYDRIMELYNVQRFNRQALNTPARSEDGRDSNYTRVAESPMVPSAGRDWTPRSHYRPPGVGSSAYAPAAGLRSDAASMDASRMTTDSRDEPSVSYSNASEIESEWVAQDEPGVYITIRQLVDGTRELRRVRFSRERFGEVRAKTWWEENRERIQAQYL